ncbi:MAG TPA: hypothetical protein VFH80_07770 [Solirubrobacteraceae bacterium]|nr:hypothetical protein [Solirubrobacteraceae bacterium]
MNASHPVEDPVLERQGKRMIGPAIRVLVIAAVMAIAGIVLILIGHGWSVGLGIAVLLLACVPGTIGFGLFTGGAVARWAARHKLFA